MAQALGLCNLRDGLPPLLGPMLLVSVQRVGGSFDRWLADVNPLPDTMDPEDCWFFRRVEPT